MDNSDLDPEEVIITSSANGVSVIHSETGKIITSYKQINIAPKCLALLADEYFIGAPANIPDIKMWIARDEKQTTQISSPCGLVNALAVTTCGSYCVAAIKQEIRVWSVRCGEMLASFSRHYQDVTCLRFTSDDSMFISSGKDGNVFVWVLSKVTSVNCDPEHVKPLYSWNHHAKEVTDIFVGSMGLYSRVATTSTDMTCKIFEIDSGLLLSTICFDVPLTSVILDSLEYFLIVGCQNGNICKINLYNETQAEMHGDTMEKEEVKAHVHEVNILSVSITGKRFLSASLDGLCKVWEVSSLSCLLTVPSNDGPFTNSFFTLSPALLMTKIEPYFHIKQLKRKFVSPNERMQAPVTKSVKLHDRPLSLIHAGSLDTYYSPANLSGLSDDGAMESDANQSLTENLFQEAFRGETLNEVRDINAQIYAYMLDQTFKSMGPLPIKEEM